MFCVGEEGCYPYRVEEREEVGRILVATRDIQPGSVIFRETELVLGPSKGTHPVCIGRVFSCKETYQNAISLTVK
jgi:hypothetical protein